MELITPKYYHAFQCIASACPDSCCKEWAVAVDADAAEVYRKLPGDLGDALREADIGHAVAGIECIGADLGNTLRNGEGGQALAIGKRTVFDLGDPLGDGIAARKTGRCFDECGLLLVKQHALGIAG